MGKYNHVSKKAQRDPGSEDRSWVLRHINGGYYKTSDNSRWVITTSIHDATKFTKEKANNILRYCISRDSASKWDILNIHNLSMPVTLADRYEREEREKEDSKIAATPTISIEMDELIPERFRDGNFNWIKFATDLIDTRNDLIKYQSVLVKLEAKNHNEELDLRHKIELGRPGNVVEGYKLYKRLRETLITRRHIKNDMKRVEALLSAQDVFLSGEVVRTLNLIENQKYNPRALPELFEDEEDVTYGKKY